MSAVVMSLATPTSAGLEANLAPGMGDYVYPLQAMAFATMGLLIVWRRGGPIGWLMCVISILYLLSDEWLIRYIALGSVVHGSRLPGVDWAAWLSAWTWIPTFTLLFMALPLLFPTGRFLSRRWAAFAAIAGSAIGVYAIVEALSPVTVRAIGFRNPIGGGLAILDFPNASSILGGVVPLLLAVYLVSIGSSVLRYRRSRGEERLQLKWFTYAIVLTVASLVGSDVVKGMFGWRSGRLLQVVLVSIPVAVAIAILKYRLYDIDVIISRTLVYGALAVFISLVYVAIVVGIGTFVGSGGRPSLALSIVATAVVAVAFQPLRERLQKVANHLVYGVRATPYEVLSRFSERVAEAYLPNDVLPRMARVLAEGTAAVRADVWLRSGSMWRREATWPVGSAGVERANVVGDGLPEMIDADRVAEVRHQGELLGALGVTKRPGESMTPIEEKLLDDLAKQAGLVLKNVGLTSDLQARLEDLRSSRLRLVAAQDQERRRLERNLHDGARQHLVALKVKLALAATLLSKDPERGRAALGQLKSEADEALQTLRDLARGIYPPLLAEQGLVAVLQAQGNKATVNVVVESDLVGRYPQEVEVAVYFCVLEALQNVQKYARATRAVVRLRGAGGQLRFEAEDDGEGFDPASVRRGSGLTNIDDRLAALGGALSIWSSPGLTVITGTCPALAIPAAEPVAV